jgi:aromatic-L-amino-acid decarboxylase
MPGPADPEPSAATSFGDMPNSELREQGHRVVDWIADYLARIDDLPVLARVAPGQVSGSLPALAPEDPGGMEAILEEVTNLILPGVTHWNHPGFFAYFGSSGSGPGILGEALCAALNVNAMLWRTSPAATELEELALEWLRQMMDLPAGFSGHIQDTASTSTLVAIATAREATGLGIRDEGMAGRDLPGLRLYCSEEAHSSVEKAAIVLGIGRRGLHRVRTDDDYRMDAGALAEAIAADRAAGLHPFCVVASIGTTSTTSIDPLADIGRICQEEQLWLHVDAAYGGAAAVVPEMRPILDGVELADSLVVNPHKWLFVPIDCSALFLRDSAATRAAFSIVPDYLTTSEGVGVTNLMDYGPALGRRFRALKLWMVLRYFGRVGIAARIREHLRLARELARWIDEEEGWERLAPVPFSTVCFRHNPGGLHEAEIDLLNERILAEVNASGEAFLSHTRPRGRYALRVAIGNIRTSEKHVHRAWELMRLAAAQPPAL